MAIAKGIETPAITVSRGDGMLIVDATVCLSCLQDGAPARVALAVVVEESNGSLSYWALEHPPSEPDFHCPRGFALRI
jgi:hypothetical protein